MCKLLKHDEHVKGDEPLQALIVEWMVVIHHLKKNHENLRFKLPRIQLTLDDFINPAEKNLTE